jgi:hypothetical protein
VNLLDQKKAESEEIKRKTEEYLNKGGKIKKLSTFDTGLKEVHGHLYHKTRGISDGSLLANQEKGRDSEDNQ